MKILSYNVNGIRAAVSHGLVSFLRNNDFDVICLQEVKADKNQIPNELIEYMQECNTKTIWNNAVRPGYSGTAIIVKHRYGKLDTAYCSVGIDELDMEGRICSIDIGDITIINAYVPNSKRGYERLETRLKWEDKIFNKIRNKDSIIYCGDMNAISRDIDIYNPTLNIPGNSKEERFCINRLLNNGFVDSFRDLHKNDVKYSWFSYFGNMRKGNLGLRLDYHLVSQNLISRVNRSEILDVSYSDHLPILLDIDVNYKSTKVGIDYEKETS